MMVMMIYNDNDENNNHGDANNWNDIDFNNYDI